MKKIKIQKSKIFNLSIDVILCKIIPCMLSIDVLSLKKTCKYFYNLIKTNKNLLFKLLYGVKKEMYYNIINIKNKRYFECTKHFEKYKKYLKNKNLILEIVKKDGWALKFVSEKLKNDKEVVLEVMKEIDECQKIVNFFKTR